MHHAQILIGGVEAYEHLQSLLIQLEFSKHANPDYIELETEVFGIDEARSLSEWSIKRPICGDLKVAVISVPHLTSEAQNALLKTLEEPPAGTYFFFILPSSSGLLLTLRSRVHLYYVRGNSEKQIHAKKFLQASIAERLAEIKNLAKNEDKNPMRELVKELEVCIPRTETKMLKRVLQAKRFIGERGSSPKMILEWLAVSIAE